MLIVGLGNPGSKYELTRHNIGFMVIDELVSSTNATKLSYKNEELYKLGSHFLLKPQTFMNLSGEAVRSIINYYKIEDDLIVIHDDLDLSFGSLRFKRGGGSGGHNGLKSIDALVGSNYIRVRLGIGKPEHRGEVTSHVLSSFNQNELQYLKEWIEQASIATKELLSSPMEVVSSKYTIKTTSE